MQIEEGVGTVVVHAGYRHMQSALTVNGTARSLLADDGFFGWALGDHFSHLILNPCVKHGKLDLT